jgi:hypothetical protein
MRAFPTIRKATLALLLAAGGSALADGPFANVHMAANRAQYHGSGCPIDIVYTANVNLHPHPGNMVFNYHWSRSDGANGPEHVVKVPTNQTHYVFKETWHLGGHGQRIEASETIHLNSGNTHEQFMTPVVEVVCR